MSMSKSAAIREAAKHVSVHGQRTSWQIIGPNRDDELSGPTTKLTADSWFKARGIAAIWKARLALRLMGYVDAPGKYDYGFAVDHEHFRGVNDVPGLIDGAIEHVRIMRERTARRLAGS